MEKNLTSSVGDSSGTRHSYHDQRAIIFPARLPPLSAEGEKEKRIHFLFTVAQVEDIIRYEVLVHPVPFSPPHIEGITEWRDHIVPIISLEGCLGIETQPLRGNGGMLSPEILSPTLSPTKNVEDKFVGEDVGDEYQGLSPTSPAESLLPKSLIGDPKSGHGHIQNQKTEIFSPTSVFGDQNTRLITVLVPQTTGDERRERLMFRVSPSIRMVSLPIPSVPVQHPEFNIRNSKLVRGIYEWESGYLVVVHMLSLFSG